MTLRNYEVATGRVAREVSVDRLCGLRNRIMLDERGSLEVACIPSAGLILCSDEEPRIVEGPYYEILRVPGERRLLASTVDECFWLDLTTGASTPAWSAGREIRSLAAHPSGARVALGLSDRIEIWDPRVPARVATLSGHAGPVNGIAWTADGETLLSVDHGGWIRVWETR